MESKEELNYEDIEFIWGITSHDDISGSQASLGTMNDIDITYDRQTKKYMLGIETDFVFKNKQIECEYLRRLLNSFTQFMEENKYSTTKEYDLFSNGLAPQMDCDSIEELYINFKILVEGHCKVYKHNYNL